MGIESTWEFEGFIRWYHHDNHRSLTLNMSRSAFNILIGIQPWADFFVLGHPYKYKRQTAVTAYFASKQLLLFVFELQDSLLPSSTGTLTVVQRQTAVTAYFAMKQLLLFVFAQQQNLHLLLFAPTWRFRLIIIIVFFNIHCSVVIFLVSEIRY